MTGYGRAKATNKRYEVAAEISSVNKRYIDFSIRLPHGYQQVEATLRKELSSKIFRGQVNVAITVHPLDPSLAIPPINWPKIEGELSLLRQISERVGCQFSAERAAFELWQQQMENEKGEEEIDPETEGLITKALLNAFAFFDERRLSEGVFLRNDLQERAKTLQGLKVDIEQKVSGQVESIRQRLSALLEKHVPSLASDDRVLREVVLYADKADVSEELARIGHHLDHVDKTLNAPAPAGKLLEFVLQELLREFNTLGAKAVQSEVSTAVVLAKTELEKMREMVQNVE